MGWWLFAKLVSLTSSFHIGMEEDPVTEKSTYLELIMLVGLLHVKKRWVKGKDGAGESLCFG